MSQPPGPLPLAAPDLLSAPPSPALSPEMSAEFSPATLGYDDANAYLSEFGLEAYAEMVEGLRLVRPAQYALVKAIELSFAEASEAADDGLAAGLEQAAHAKKAELLQGSFARILELVSDIHQDEANAGPAQLVTEANRLASHWFDTTYSAARIRRAPIYPDDILCFDYLKPKLLNHKPKESDPVAVKESDRPAESSVVLREVEDGQLYAPVLLGKYRRPPLQQLGSVVIEVDTHVNVNGQLTMEYADTHQESPIIDSLMPSEDLDPATDNEKLGLDPTESEVPQDEQSSTRELPQDGSDLIDELAEEMDPDMLIDILGDLDDFELGADLEMPADDPGDLEGIDDQESDSNEEGESSSDARGKRGSREKDSLIVESIQEEYSYDYVLRTGTELEKLVARYVIEQDPAIEEVDITNERSFQEIARALRKCLYMREYIASDDLAVRGRFAHISERAQGAGKGQSNNEKWAKKAAKKLEKPIKTEPAEKAS